MRRATTAVTTISRQTPVFTLDSGVDGENQVVTQPTTAVAERMVGVGGALAGERAAHPPSRATAPLS